VSVSQTADAHDALRRQVRDFVQTYVAPHVKRMETAAGVEKDVSRLLAETGWLGVTIPRSYGGMDAGHMAKTIIDEEVSRVSAAMGAMLQASQLGTAKILHFGTPEQKAFWLPQIAQGRCLPTIAVTEEGSGGHVLGMQSAARKSGSEYVLTGRKVYVGNSHVGGLHGVVVRTGKGSRGLSAFLVEADRPGLELAPHQPAIGLRGFSFGTLILDNCRVPEGNLIGEIGDGRDVAYSSSILYGRPNLTAVSLGIHQALLDTTIAYARHCERYDGPLIEVPTVWNLIGQMQSRLMSARGDAYDAVARYDKGEACDAYLINAKYTGVEALLDSARDAMKIHGAAGLITSGTLERLYRDAPAMYAPAGTGHIQIHRLAEHAVGVNRPQFSARFPGTRPAAGALAPPA
jgi:alkylation response protein AidB-like acyl-CoA dehydrogenase